MYANPDITDSFTTPTGIFPIDIAGTQLIASGLLLGGTSIGNIVFTPGTDFDTLTILGTDTKNLDMLAFFGIDPNTTFNFANTNITVSGGAVTQADLTNTFKTPEPALLTMLGVGLLAVGRRFSRRHS